MQYATLFLFAAAALAVAVHGRPSARTFGSSQHPAHPHDAHNHATLGAQHDTTNHGVQAGGDSSATMLVCQVVKVPVGQSGAPPSHAAPGVDSASIMPSVVASGPQEALSSLNSRVRTALERIIDPVVTALQNTSLWLNRTSQMHQSHQHPALHHDHQHQHAGMANHAHVAHNHHEHAGIINHAHNHVEHQHTQHGGHAHHPGTQGQVHNHPGNPAHVPQLPQTVPNQAVPMTVVSVPVLVPAVHGGPIPVMNLSSSVPANVNVPSLHFSNPGQGNATTLSPVELVNATLQSASTAADANLLGRTADLPTTPVTDVTLTRASDVSTTSTLSSIFTIWFRSGTVEDSTEATSTSERTTSSQGPVYTSSTDASTPGLERSTTVSP
uniref:Putative large his rich 1 n=1 Tax=Rhipicephalus microplus TaxID=6941 RepID=A0A6M2D5K5_RHIMP